MLGNSPSFQNIFNLIQNISNSDVPVFIDGEKGAGKEFSARAIHMRSQRKHAPFEILECSVAPEAEIEEELLALSKVSPADEAGNWGEAGNRVEADLLHGQLPGGTLFLKDVDALKPTAQAALLRFLQEHQRRALGGGGLNVRDVRILAASSKDVPALVASGDFRQDLFYRLSLMKLRMPPLRERRQDVMPLAEHFLKACAVRYGSEKQLDAATREWMQHYDWPGNIDELELMINREYLAADDNVIVIPSRLAIPEERRRLPDRRSVNVTSLSFSKAKLQAIREFEYRYLDAILAKAEGNITRAASMVGKERRSLGKLLKKHGIDRQQYIRKAGLPEQQAGAIAQQVSLTPAWGASMTRAC